MYQIKIGETHNKNVSTLGDVLAFLNHRGDDLKALKPIEVTVSRGDASLEVVYGSGKFGIIQEGSAQAIFEAMFKEIELFYVKPGDKVIPPHEMTRDQWNAVVAVRKAAGGEYPCFTRDQFRETCKYDGAKELFFSDATVSYFCDHLFRTRFGWEHRGPSYDGKGNVSSSHELYVAYALAAGKHVPEWVLADYRGPGAGTLSCTGKPDWFTTLIRVPHLRGAIPAEKLQMLVTVLSWEKMEITKDNVGDYIQAMREFPHSDPSSIDMDDFLYEKGFMKPREVQPIPAEPEVEAFSPLAVQLRDAMAEAQRAKQIAYINKQLATRQLSLRQYEHEIAMAKALRSSAWMEYGNKVAKAVVNKDISYLLTLLDGPDDWNTSTKRALQKYVGLKLLGLKSAARTTAIYDFCGYGQQARAEYEQKQESAAAKAKADRREKEVIKLVESVRYRVPTGGVVTGKEFIDQAIRDGFNEITTTPYGRGVKYALTNRTTGLSFPLIKKDGTVDYAEIAIAHAKAVAAEAVASQQAA